MIKQYKRKYKVWDIIAVHLVSFCFSRGFESPVLVSCILVVSIDVRKGFV